MSQTGIMRYVKTLPRCHTRTLNTSRQHSKIFVQNDHLCWDPSRARKHRKKWGKLIRSEHTQIDEMLARHKDEVYEYLLEKKDAFVDPGDDTSVDENALERMRSPPLDAGLRSPRQASVRSNGIGNGNGEGEGAKLPPIGHFSVGGSARNSPHVGASSPSPASPLRQGFGRS